MYPSGGATIRADINAVVEEASAADTFHIGALVMPPLGVSAKSGTYPKIDIAGGALLDAVATERAASGSYGEVSRKWGTDTYDCVDRGLEEAVDDAEARDLARYFNAELTAARLTLRNMRLAHEVRVAAAIMNTSNFGSGTNSAVAYTAANLATIDFAQDVLAAIDRVEDNAVQVNTIVLSKAVLTRLALSTKLQNWVRGQLKGNGDMPMNAANIAASFADYGITRVLVGRARQNTAKKGAAKSVSQIWGNTYVWVGNVNPNASMAQDGGAGFTLYWNQEGGVFVSETYRNENRRSTMVRVRQNTAEKVVDGTSGTLITTQYS
ncbi:MAG: hypothetical protein J0M24_13835 [Verrucomicrobia bacterium]|nr:hypothetical protein [Verrucomicrobiota bacterium]